MPLYRTTGGGSGLPEGGDPGQMLGKDEFGEVVWIDDGPSLFRGAWAPDELVWVSDFSTGLNAPFSTLSGGANASLPVTSPVVPAGQPYTVSVYNKIQNAAPEVRSTLRLNLAALNLQGLTRVAVWTRFFDSFSSFETYAAARIYANTTEIFSRSPTSSNAPTWVDSSVAIPQGTTQLDFVGVALNQANYETGPYFTGIRLYASAEPYMLGEFVTHAGEMWKSLVNNNSQTPSKTSTSWERAITLPPPLGTTANRPTAVSAGAGFQYFDTTLVKPIWSDGTTWRDATGTAV